VGRAPVTASETVLIIGLALMCLVAAGLAYRATKFERMLLQSGLLLGATVLEYGGSGGHLIVSSHTLDQFENDHTVHAEALAIGGVIISAVRVQKEERAS
jgi:glycerol dehydrogenase-like iron-containing ADH family enzyme